MFTKTTYAYWKAATVTIGEIDSVSFAVRGTPTPKGSLTRMPNGATIPAGTAESRKRMDTWRMDIRNEARRAMGERPALTGPVRLFVEFAFLPPKSLPKRYVGWVMHTKKPDVDKLFRALSDALTGIVWRDDSQVCMSAINKVYAWDGVSGAVVSIEPISDESAKTISAQTRFLRERVRHVG